MFTADNKAISGVVHEYQVKIGGRLVAIVSALGSTHIFNNIEVESMPDKPSVPILKLNGSVAS